MKKTAEIITDEQINIAWANADFGTTPRREILRLALLKVACGFSLGRTADCIIKELGLVGNSAMKGGTLTKKGKMYLWQAMEEYATQPAPDGEKWISVEERLPALSKFNESDYVLCITEYTEQVVCWYSADRKGWIVANHKANSIPIVHEITYWQPLPAIPNTQPKPVEAVEVRTCVDCWSTHTSNGICPECTPMS